MQMVDEDAWRTARFPPMMGTSSIESKTRKSDISSTVASLEKKHFTVTLSRLCGYSSVLTFKAINKLGSSLLFSRKLDQRWKIIMTE